MSNGYDDLVQAQIELSKRPKKKHTKLFVFLLLLILGVTIYYLPPFYFTHVRHDSIVSEFVYKGREIERFFWGDNLILGEGTYTTGSNNTSEYNCVNGWGWTAPSGSERFLGEEDTGEQASKQEGYAYVKCWDKLEAKGDEERDLYRATTLNDFAYYEWNENKLFEVYFNASEHEFYLWERAFIVDGVMYSQSTQVPLEARWTVEVTWVWDAEAKTLEPVFSFHNSPLSPFWEGAKNHESTNEENRISAEEFFAQSGATWEQLDGFAHELLYERFLPVCFTSNPDSRYSMDNLGDITIIEGTHKEIPDGQSNKWWYD